MNKNIILCASIATLLASPITQAHSPEGCATYTWNLEREFAAFGSPPTPIDTDPSADRARALEPGRHYTLALHAQSGIAFAAAPERARKAEHAMAGVVSFRTGKAGRYRVSLTSHHWLDVVDDGRLVASLGHEGRGGCAVLHKVVEFDLPADRLLAIQLSGADAHTVGLVITGPI